MQPFGDFRAGNSNPRPVLSPLAWCTNGLLLDGERRVCVHKWDRRRGGKGGIDIGRTLRGKGEEERGLLQHLAGIAPKGWSLHRGRGEREEERGKLL